MDRAGLVSIGQKALVYAVGSALAYIVLSVGLYYLDPDRPRAASRKKQIAKRYGRPIVQTNMYEDIIAQDIVIPDEINVTFEAIGGLEHVKQSLLELVVLPLQRPELFAHGKLLGLHKGILLYGPPGTGKTLLAKAIAKESGAVFINVKIANLLSKWLGDNEKLVDAVFSLAYKLQPSIIFLDEVDSFLGQRRSFDHETSTSIKTEFMSLWDGFSTDQRARVMVLAATNRPWELDEAVLRRLPRAFEVGMPDMKQRASILKVILKDENVEPLFDYEWVASMCEDFSGSDLRDLCKQAAYLPIKELLANEKSGNLTCQLPRPLQTADFERVLTTSTRSKVAARDYDERRLHRSQTAETVDFNLSDISIESLIQLLSDSNIQNDTEV